MDFNLVLHFVVHTNAATVGLKLVSWAYMVLVVAEVRIVITDMLPSMTLYTGHLPLLLAHLD